MKKLFLVILILLNLLRYAYAQQNNIQLIDVDFKQAGITQIAADLQSKTGYHFYYDPAQFDSLKVTLQLSQKTLFDVLDRMFKNSAYHYTVSGQHEVVLTKGYEITTTLPGGFFNDRPGNAT